MDYLYITGQDARTIRKIARHDCGLALEPAENRSIVPLDRNWTPEDTRLTHELLRLLGFSEHKKLELRVPSAGSRIRAACVRSVVCSVGLPEGSFDRLIIQDSSLLHLPENTTILVDAPPLSFISAARQLTRLVSRGVMSQTEADLRLLKVGVEDCGRYSLDPWNPSTKSFRSPVPAVMTVRDLLRFIDSAAGLDGLTQARRVGPCVFERSDSPMEALVHSGVALPLGLGGFSLPGPEANVTIPLSGFQQLMLNHVDHITPDLLWEAMRIIVEYLGGEPHSSKDAQEEDAGRVQDYQVLGYLVFPVMYKHVRTPEVFNRLVIRLAHAMEGKGLKGASEWVATLLDDEGFIERQRCLFKVMLPSVSER